MNFYVLRPDEKYKYVDFDDNFDHFDSVKCPVDQGHRRADRNDLPLHVEFKSKKYGDFAYTWFADWIINQKTADILIGQNLSGYELQQPVIKNKEIVEPLWEMLITGNGGAVHPDSGIHITATCEHCGLIEYSNFAEGKGIIVDEEKWDGSDFFYLSGCGKLLVITEKAKNVIEANKLSGAIIIPSNDLRLRC